MSQDNSRRAGIGPPVVFWGKKGFFSSNKYHHKSVSAKYPMEIAAKADRTYLKQ